MSEAFSVWAWCADDSHFAIDEHVNAERAVTAAWRASVLAEAGVGDVERITIVDADDCTVFLWRLGAGVVYPTPAMREAARERAP